MGLRQDAIKAYEESLRLQARLCAVLRVDCEARDGEAVIDGLRFRIGELQGTSPGVMSEPLQVLIGSFWENVDSLEFLGRLLKDGKQ